MIASAMAAAMAAAAATVTATPAAPAAVVADVAAAAGRAGGVVSTAAGAWAAPTPVGASVMVAVIVAAVVLVLPTLGAGPDGVGAEGAGDEEAGAATDDTGRLRRKGTPVVAVAEAADLLALALHSGTGVVESLEVVADHLDGIRREHLRTVATALRWGVEPSTAWGAVPEHWAGVGRALALAARSGLAPATLLAEAADDLRRREAHRVELATARLGVRIVLPLGLTFLPAFALTTVVPVVLALAGEVIGP